MYDMDITSSRSSGADYHGPSPSSHQNRGHLRNSRRCLRTFGVDDCIASMRLLWDEVVRQGREEMPS